MDKGTVWLTEDEQRVWRGWLAAHRRVMAELHRELQTGCDLSIADYEVLVNLTDVTVGRMRMSRLADEMDWERSRLSHQVKRMEARGLVARTDCDEDRRGQMVAITTGGRRAIRKAAPHHVAAVRRLVFDRVGSAELRQLDRTLTKMLDGLDASSGV